MLSRVPWAVSNGTARAAALGLLAYVAVQVLWPAPLGVVAQGVVFGAIASLLALGLALIYRANRIVNFAQADLGGVGATAAVVLMTRGWSFVPAIVIGLLITAAVGAIVQRLFIHRFFKAPRLILTVVTIGISQILIAITTLLPNLLIGEAILDRPPSPVDVSISVDPIAFRGWEVFAALTVPLVVVGLFVFLRRTATGMAIRGTAESAERASLLGIPVNRIQTLVWVAAAGLSFWGLLLRAGTIGALGQLGTGSGPAVLTRALAACVIGRMERFGVIVAASIALGVLEQAVIWDTGRSTYATVVQFVILLGALLVQRAGPSRSDSETSSWSVAAATRAIPAELRNVTEVVFATKALRWGLVGVTLVVPLVLDAGKTSLAALVLVYALLGLSLVLLTGWAGQVSLGQAALFGIGGAVAAALLLRGWDPLLGLLGAGIVGAVAAVVVGLPALRIKGLYLAVTTLAFAVLASTYLISPETVHWVPGSSEFIERRPLFGRIDILDERSYYYLCAACFLLGVVMVRGLRESRTGRLLLAVRDNERAAQSYGVSAMRTKLVAFAFSGFLAAVAGGLYTYSQQALSTARFAPAESLRVFTMVVIGGMGSIPGAIAGSLYLNGTQWFVDIIDSIWVRTVVSFLGTGVGLILVLLVLPGGLGGLLYRARDWWLRGVAARRGIVVPSLTADGATALASTPAVARSEPGGTPPAGALVLRDVEVAYDGVQVLFGVDLVVQPGEIVALLGTNGAGKSTVLRAITGLTKPLAGSSVVFDGVDLTSMPAHEVVRHGVAQVPGGRGVFPGLTVGENLRLATWIYRRDDQRVADAIERTLTQFPILREKYGALAGDLSGGQQQMLTLGMAFMTEPRLLMIDELSLGLAPVIVQELIESVRSLRDAGMTVVLVEQSVNVALTVADRAYFLEKGEVRFSGPTEELLARPDVLRSVFLQGVATNGASARRVTPAAARPLLEVHGARRSFGGVAAVKDVSLELRHSEILGIIGPNGAGKTTLFDLISGFASLDAGQIVVDGTDVTSLPPHARAQRGLGRSFQDARLFPGLTVRETIAVACERMIPIKDPFAAALNLPAVAETERLLAHKVEDLIEMLGLGAFRDKHVSELSTGSRRIVDLACVMAHRPRVLLFDEPSSGIAQRETEALGPLIRQIQRESGASILVIEHDMPLIASVSDRLIAMNLGSVMATGAPAEVLADPEVIRTYLGTDDAVINRSDSSERRPDALAVAGPRRRRTRPMNTGEG